MKNIKAMLTLKIKIRVGTPNLFQARGLLVASYVGVEKFCNALPQKCKC